MQRRDGDGPGPSPIGLLHVTWQPITWLLACSLPSLACASRSFPPASWHFGVPLHPVCIIISQTTSSLRLHNLPVLSVGEASESTYIDPAWPPISDTQIICVTPLPSRSMHPRSLLQPTFGSPSCVWCYRSSCYHQIHHLTCSHDNDFDSSVLLHRQPHKERSLCRPLESQSGGTYFPAEVGTQRV